ncbi:MAG: HsdM family class I SAM-dependent methyltransferase [Candidatus Hodarchaeales archaeon]
MPSDVDIIETILMDAGISISLESKFNKTTAPKGHSRQYQGVMSGKVFSIVITRRSELINGLINAISLIKSLESSHCILIVYNYSERVEYAPGKRTTKRKVNQIDSWFLRVNQPPNCHKIPLERLPSWINSQILNERDNTEIDSDLVIDCLQKLIAFINEHVISKDNLIFHNVLANDTNHDENLRKTIGAYLFINQLLLRRIISNLPDDGEYLTGEEMATAEINDKQVLRKIIENRELTINPSFTESNKSKTILRNINDIIDCLKPEMISQDLMGKVFHRMIPANLRKHLAAYYTKALPARILAGLAIDNPFSKIIDPACGSGTLLLEALKRKECLATVNTDSTYPSTVAEITGIDVMAFSTHLAALNLAIHTRSFFRDYIRIGIMDSTQVFHDTVIRDSVNGSQWIVGKHEVVIMNPPFTKKQSILVFGSNYRVDLQERFQKEYADLISYKSPLYQYFILIADRLLEKRGRIAAILPTALLRSKDAEKLRNWLKEKYLIKYIIVRIDAPNFSEDTQFREMIFIADKALNRQDANNNDVNIVFIKKLDSNIIKMIRDHTENQKVVNDEYFRMKTIKQLKLCQSNFFTEIAFVSSELEEFWKKISENKFLIKLDPNRGRGRIKIRAKGTPTPRGMSFEKLSINAKDSLNSVLRSDRWIIETKNSKTGIMEIKYRKSGEILTVDSQFFVKHFRRCPYRNKMDITELEEFVVKNPDVKALSRYLKLSGIKTDNWEKWNSFIKKGTSHLGFADRIDVSATGSCLLSWFSLEKTAWGRIPSSIGGLSVIEAKFLCLWFNSTFNFIQYLYIRNETRGAWMQLHKYIIEDILIPEMSLVNEYKDEIVRIFEKVKDTRFPPIVRQFVRLSREIGKNTEKLLQELYPEYQDELNNGFTARYMIDTFFARILKQSVDFGRIYPLVLNELLILRKLMDKQ